MPSSQNNLFSDLFSHNEGTQRLDRMKKDCIFYKRAYEDNSQTPMWQYMLEYFVESYAQMAKQNLGTDTLDTQILYSIRLYCIIKRHVLIYDLRSMVL